MAINAFNRELISYHIKGCVTRDIKNGNEEIVDELVDIWKEGKLSLIRRSDEINPVFAVTPSDAVAAGADLMTGYRDRLRQA